MVQAPCFVFFICLRWGIPMTVFMPFSCKGGDFLVTLQDKRNLMEYDKVAVAGLVVLFFCGCAAQRHAFTTPASQPVLQRQETIAYPDNRRHKVADGMDKIKAETQVRVDEANARKTAELAAELAAGKTFSKNASANVRVPGVNPLPAKGLNIDLKAQRENFCFPYPRAKVISPFGSRGRRFHSGVDLKAVPVDTIRAAFSGVVRMSKPYSGYGNIIVIQHDNGLETVYSHQKRNFVKVNDRVQAGDAIGFAGRSGRATTEHLHFEVRVACQAINPGLILDYANRTLRTGHLIVVNRGGRIVAVNTDSTSPQ